MREVGIMKNPRSTATSNKVDAYRINDDLAGSAYCRIARSDAARYVEDGLMHWCNCGAAVQLNESVSDRLSTNSAITDSECAANAGIADNESRIAAARCKVRVWLLVGADPEYGKPTKAPLPIDPGAIRIMGRDELQRLSGTPVPFVGYGSTYTQKAKGGNKRAPCSFDTIRPVDQMLREHRKLTLRLEDDEFVRRAYDDLGESDETDGARKGLPHGYHLTDDSEDELKLEA